MKRDREFDDILNECIERVLKGESVEACLGAFPEHAAELEPLLRTAVETRKAAAILPRPEFRQQAGYEFQAAIRDLGPPQRGFFRWQMRWVAVVSIVIVILLAGSGTVAASANSLPDQPLYRVKLATEEVRLALTPSALGKAELYTGYADIRVNEIIKMADKGDVAQVVKTTERMNDHLTAIAKLIQPGGDAGMDGDEAPQAFLSTSAANITAESAQAPDTGLIGPAAAQKPAPVTAPTPIPTVKPTPTLTPNTAAKTPNATLKTTPVPSTAQARAVTSNVSKPGVTVKTAVKSKVNAQTKLNTTVTKQAEKNTQDLEEALKRAPDSVKPALEKAIKDAQKGYDKALKNTEQKKK
jgi:hypothetical protein